MTDWFYVKEGQQAGPLSESQVRRAFDSGDIVSSTLMWTDGMADWTAYELVKDRIHSTGGSPGEASTIACPNCHSTVSTDDLVQMGQAQICVMCKDQYVQRIREGLDPSGLDVRYGGFWLRFCAVFLDGIILNLIQWPLRFLLPLLFSRLPEATFILSYAISLLVTFAYHIFFVGNPKTQATPGKLAVGLRIIRADGGPMTYAHAAGRYLGTMLSSFTLGIGYLMCVWDDENRCLHDRICNTRVIHKK
ncbi:MAG: RDD family protein [Phycisphaeraceae bacterium]|nr:RDD family protein [Phycisphaeraceae bacterium]